MTSPFTGRTRSSRRTRSLGAMVAVATVAALTLSGCTTWFNEARPAVAPTATSTPVQEEVAENLASYYQQEVEWAACEDEAFQCGTVKAPMDWNDPQRESIELAVVRQPATGGDPLGSLLVNPGGPGGSGYDFVYYSIGFAVDQELQAAYDVVGFDPRGVGRSSAVTCLSDEEMDAYLYDIPTTSKDDEAGRIAESMPVVQGFADACATNTGELLGYIDTISAARDLDLLRAVMGDKKLNYLGYSYGTFLGSTFADLYPDKVGRLVLDGAIDPTIDSFGMSIGQAVGFENSIRAYMADCLSGADCPFSGSVDDGMARIQALLASADANPLNTEDGRQVGSSTLLTAIVYPLYNSQGWPALSDMLDSFMSGDAEDALYFADSYNGRESDGTYLDNSTEAFNTYNCMDYPVSLDPAVIAQQNLDIIAASPTIGPYWINGHVSCSVWPNQPTRVPTAVTAEGSDPILVVGTTGDPATPYKWAEALATQLSNSQLITFEGDVHTAYGKSSCVKKIVNEYFLTGTVPSSDPMCTK